MDPETLMTNDPSTPGPRPTCHRRPHIQHFLTYISQDESDSSQPTVNPANTTAQTGGGAAALNATSEPTPLTTFKIHASSSSDTATISGRLSPPRLSTP